MVLRRIAIGSSPYSSRSVTATPTGHPMNPYPGCRNWSRMVECSGIMNPQRQRRSTLVLSRLIGSAGGSRLADLCSIAEFVRTIWTDSRAVLAVRSEDADVLGRDERSTVLALRHTQSFDCTLKAPLMPPDTRFTDLSKASPGGEIYGPDFLLRAIRRRLALHTTGCGNGVGGLPERWRGRPLECSHHPHSHRPLRPIDGRPTIDGVADSTDLTALGRTIHQLLQEAPSAGGGLILCLDSLAAPVEAGSVRRAFRFLHILTRVVDSCGATAYYHADTALATEDLESLRVLFDAELHPRRSRHEYVDATANFPPFDRRRVVSVTAPGTHVVGSAFKDFGLCVMCAR